MTDERGVLPDAKEAPLIVDAEFTETDEVVGSPILDSVERVELSLIHISEPTRPY